MIWDLKFVQISNWVIRPGLEIHPNDRGKIVFSYLYKFDHYVFFFFEYEIYLIFLTLGLLVALSCRCLTEAVVAEIIANPHALDSCEYMNIEGQILRKT